VLLCVTNEFQTFESEGAGQSDICHDMGWAQTFDNQLRGFEVVARDDGPAFSLQTYGESICDHEVVVENHDQLRVER
jgi:hypothetical protein